MADHPWEHLMLSEMISLSTVYVLPLGGKVHKDKGIYHLFLTDDLNMKRCLAYEDQYVLTTISKNE